MTSPHPHAEAEPAVAPPRSPGWLVPLLAVVALVLVAETAVMTWALTRTPAPVRVTSGPAIAVHGSLKLTSPGLGETGSGCQGGEGYSDIHAGTQVTITDPAGVVLAIGQLGPGLPIVVDGFRSCVFRFTAISAPSGKGIYGIEVSHRGVMRFEEARLAGDIELTLG